MRAKIIGTGSYVPEQILTNADFEELADTTDEWIYSRTGIRERRVVKKNQATSDLAIEAAKRAMDDAGVRPEDIDLIILATLSSDMIEPAAACFVEAGLGIKGVPVFDINAACSGFIYGLSIAEQYIKNNVYNTALVIGAEILCYYCDRRDKNTGPLFGDGAGAAVVKSIERDDESGIINIKMYADGRLSDLVMIPGGGTRNPPSYESLEEKLYFVRLKGHELFKAAVRCMADVTREVIIGSGYQLADIALIIPHQANKRIIDAVGRNLNLPEDKVFVNLERYGNTSAASIPLALDEASKSGRIKEGDLVVLVGFGGGLTWAAALIRW